jgi:hypothetical protein
METANTTNNSATTDTQLAATKPVSQVGNIILSAIMAILGLTFISLCDRHDDISHTILMLGGFAFVLPGVTVLLSIFVNRKGKAAKTADSNAANADTAGANADTASNKGYTNTDSSKDDAKADAVVSTKDADKAAKEATRAADAKRAQGPVMSLLMTICGLAAVALGIVILVVPEVFRPLLVYLFGALLIFSAAWQFNLMMRRNRTTLYPIWLMVAPILIVVLGVVMMTLDAFKGTNNEKTLVLATGIGFTLFGLIGLSISYIALKARAAAKKAASTPAA